MPRRRSRDPALAPAPLAGRHRSSPDRRRGGLPDPAFADPLAPPRPGWSPRSARSAHPVHGAGDSPIVPGASRPVEEAWGGRPGVGAGRAGQPGWRRAAAILRHPTSRPSRPHERTATVPPEAHGLILAAPWACGRGPAGSPRPARGPRRVDGPRTSTLAFLDVCISADICHIEWGRHGAAIIAAPLFGFRRNPKSADRVWRMRSGAETARHPGRQH